jgi:GntR family transcriptional repressor for pyruvate dehydrogenase complex
VASARVTTPTANALISELSGAARLLLAQEGGIQRFQEAHTFFEVGLARLAAERATDEDIRNLRSALEENRKMVGDHEVSGAPPSTTPSLPFRKTRSSSLCTTRSPNG